MDTGRGLVVAAAILAAGMMGAAYIATPRYTFHIESTAVFRMDGATGQVDVCVEGKCRTWAPRS